VFGLLDPKTKQEWIEKATDRIFTLIVGIAGTLGIQTQISKNK
jgi:hypothetical protein